MSNQFSLLKIPGFRRYFLRTRFQHSLSSLTIELEAYEVIQLDMAVEAGDGRDEVEPAEYDSERGGCSHGKLESNELCRGSGPGEELVRST